VASADKGGPAAEPVAVAAAPAEAEVSRELPKGTTEALERAASLDPKFVAPHYWLGWIALSEKDPAKAQLAFARALALNPQHVRSVVGMAEAQLREAKLVDAETRVTRAIEDLAATMTQPERCETYLLAASIAVARMQPPLAIENLLSALQADPRNRRATRELGEQFFRAGEFDRALEHFKQNAALSAGDPESTLGLIKAEFGKKDWVALQKALPPAIAQYPRDGRFLYWMGRVQEELVAFDKARAQYEKAIQADPNYLRPYIRLAELDFRSNDIPSARKRLDEALGVGSASSEVANEVGETFLEMGETNRAVAAFRAALTIDRSNPDARINLAGHFIATRQFREALDELNEMIAAGVASPRVKLRQASAMIGVGEADKAIETLLKLLEAEPKNPDYLFELGLAHMENKSWQSARENFASAFEQAPSMDSALYHVGRCELELGHINEAISALTRVSQRNPSGEYHYWLGQAMARVQGDQAMTEYTQAIEQDASWSLENPEVFFERAKIYQSRKQNVLAKLDLGVVLTLQPEHAPALWLLGRVLYEERDFLGAIARLDHAIAIDPKQSEAHFYAALCYLALPVPENGKALTHLQQAVAGGLAESTPRVLEKMAYAKAQAGDTGGAIGDLQRYLDKVPTLPSEQQRSYKNQIDRWRSNR
jgi:tetratricopeptide (TPR) repeat protein